MSKNKGSGVIIYSSLIWSNIWSHSHDLTTALSKKFHVYYLEVPKNNAEGHEHLIPKKHHDVPENAELVTPKCEFKSFGLFYFIYSQWFSMISFFRLMKKIDVLVTYNTYDILMLMLAKIYGKRVIFMYVDEYEHLTPNAFFRSYIRMTLNLFIRHSDAVVCTARTLEQKAKKNNKHVTYMPNSVRLSEFRNMKKNSGKKSKGKFIVGFVGSLGDWIDVDAIADAAMLLSHDKNIEFWIIGAGPGYGKLEDRIKRMKDDGINTIKLFGFMDRKNALKKMLMFNIAIIPFKLNDITDSVSPVKLFEYWMTYNPVIATRTKELSQFDKELLFFKDGDDLAEKILMLHRNPGLMRKLADNGRKIVIDKYNWENYADKYISIVDDG